MCLRVLLYVIQPRCQPLIEVRALHEGWPGPREVLIASIAPYLGRWSYRCPHLSCCRPFMLSPCCPSLVYHTIQHLRFSFHSCCKAPFTTTRSLAFSLLILAPGGPKTRVLRIVLWIRRILSRKVTICPESAGLATSSPWMPCDCPSPRLQGE